MNYNVVISNLVISPLTLAQLEAFLTAGMAAIPGAELQSITLTVTPISNALPPVSTTSGGVQG